MNNNSSTHLFDGAGGYNTFIQDHVVPKLLKVIEQSGLSFEDAKRVPPALMLAIDHSISEMIGSTKFTTDFSSVQ